MRGVFTEAGALPVEARPPAPPRLRRRSGCV